MGAKGRGLCISFSWLVNERTLVGANSSRRSGVSSWRSANCDVHLSHCPACQRHGQIAHMLRLRDMHGACLIVPRPAAGV